MALWFKKKSENEFREVALPGEVGFISVPADFIVEDEDDSTVLAYPPGDEVITVRFSSISFAKKDDDEQTGLAFVKKKAREERLNYSELGDKGVLSFEEESEQQGTPLLIKYWEVGADNTIVIVSATIIKAKRDDKTVTKTLLSIPAMLESLKITKHHKIIQADGREVNATVQAADPEPQTLSIFGESDLEWLKTSLDRARALGIKYGSGGELGPEELDRVFSRWMHEEGDKEQDRHIADTLGAAFGTYLVQHDGFEWVIVTDEYGTEYGVKHQIRDTIAFPRASVIKRIEDKEPEFFQNLYLLILDGLKNAGARSADDG